jgi:formylglycine-generating enzyme required for sulfatase activity
MCIILSNRGIGRTSQLKHCFLSILVILCIAVSISSAFAEKRVALVIGNSAYQFAPLPNPKNDAVLMTQTLQGLGFDVITAIDASQKAMKKAVRKFGKKLDAAGKEGVGLFFYAGHGVQVKGANYLIPTNAQIETEGDVDIEAINAQSILSMMEFSGARLSFVIMDACRNNPFKRSFRSGARGLAKMEAPTGSLVAYATAPGDVASDGTGNNSPYTTALARMMTKPGLSVERMFREVRNSVRGETNNKQTPWESSSLVGGDFFFAGPGNLISSTKAIAPRPAPTVEVSPLDEKMIALKNANIRDKPTTRGHKIGKIGAGTSIDVIGRTHKGGANWFLVALPNGETGYVFGSLLIPQQVDVTVMPSGPKPSKSEFKGQPGDNVVSNSILNLPDPADNPRIIQRIMWSKLIRDTAPYLLLRWNHEKGRLNEVKSTYEWQSKYPFDYNNAVSRLIHNMAVTPFIQSNREAVVSYNHYKRGTQNIPLAMPTLGESSDKRIDRYLAVLQKLYTDYFSAKNAENFDLRSFIAAALGERRFVAAKLSFTTNTPDFPENFKLGETFSDCSDCPEMLIIPAGSFRMGDYGRNGGNTERPVRRVTIPRAFAVSKYEVTQYEWQEIMGTNPSGSKDEEYPVESISWVDAIAFVQELSARTGKRYRLLSEAEWEYMARAGSKTEYPMSKDIYESQANFDHHSTKKAGSDEANAFGVHNSVGNVWEWVADCWHKNYEGGPVDGSSWSDSKGCPKHVIRGGSYKSKKFGVRSAHRASKDTNDWERDIGIRVARDLP